MAQFRILIIDPDTATTAFLTKELRQADFETFASTSVKEGLILAYQNRPHVIIFDPVFELAETADLIDRIRKDRRLSRTQVIAFSSLQTPTDIQNAVDLGFDEYLPKDAQALSKLLEVSRRAAIEARSPGGLGSPSSSQAGGDPKDSYTTKSGGKTIIFLSSKGGLGTSSLCANIAHITNLKQDKKVSVVDLVLPIGSIDAIVGASRQTDIVQAASLTSESEITEYLSRSLEKPPNWNFKLLPGANSPETSDQLDVSRIPLIIQGLKNISDFVFIDLGKSLSRIILPTIVAADLIVLTLSLDQSTVAQTKTVWEFLQKKGVKEDQVYFLINRAVSLEGLAKSEVEKILGMTIQLTVPYMGVDFTLANNLNQPIADKFPQDSVTISLRQASDEILRKIEKRSQKMDFF
jgi:MinD-like ATPase involved in chromosome partitioning or flagellar assembly/CheY-like chemotaxis protein